MLTKTQLTTMLGLQDKLNSAINPEWRKANNPWHRAIMVEAVECLEHVGWKWWKKQEPDLTQAKIELVDIWHFILSKMIEECSGDHEWAAVSIDTRFGIDTLHPHSTQKKLDELIEYAARGLLAPVSFIGLMRDFGLTWDELYATYIGKNVLNMFRQDHGYRAGTYRKDWMGKEDNVSLDILLKTMPDATPEQLYAKLEEVYAKVCATPITA